jgi:hypothetical protein
VLGITFVNREGPALPPGALGANDPMQGPGVRELRLAGRRSALSEPRACPAESRWSPSGQGFPGRVRGPEGGITSARPVSIVLASCSLSPT